MNRKLFLSIVVLLSISGCTTHQNVWERERSAKELEQKAEEAREIGNYPHAAELEKQAKKMRNEDSLDKSNLALIAILIAGKFIINLFSDDETDTESSGWP